MDITSGHKDVYGTYYCLTSLVTCSGPSGEWGGAPLTHIPPGFLAH